MIAQHLRGRKVPLVKICGITRSVDAMAAARAGADFIGFVFAAGSPRCISPAVASAIAAEVRTLPSAPRLAGVFLDQSASEVRAIADAVRLDLVQLHGSESPVEFEAIGLPLIKTLHVRDRMPDASPWKSAEWLLFEGAGGGTGRTFDWDLLHGLSRRPFFLAGGLDPSNVGGAIAKLEPDAVDVSSGVEERPGIKSAARIARFIEEARRA